MNFLNKDQLEKMDENRLKKIFLDVRRRINEARDKRSDKRQKEKLLELETYYCYVYRELEVRKVLQSAK
tara:strand:- start:117 stop:323 length:207 start_codon:yes stop_codon:yes gene_type:complete